MNRLIGSQFAPLFCAQEPLSYPPPYLHLQIICIICGEILCKYALQDHPHIHTHTHPKKQKKNSPLPFVPRPAPQLTHISIYFN